MKVMTIDPRMFAKKSDDEDEGRVFGVVVTVLDENHFVVSPVMMTEKKARVVHSPEAAGNCAKELLVNALLVVVGTKKPRETEILEQWEKELEGTEKGGQDGKV